MPIKRYRPTPTRAYWMPKPELPEIKVVVTIVEARDVYGRRECLVQIRDGKGQLWVREKFLQPYP